MNLRAWLATLAAAGLAGSMALPRPAGANAELDRKYSLETIGALRSLDNVDGLFADYVAAAYRDYFARQTRFRLQDLSKADTVLTTSKLSYAKAIEDLQILGQLSRSLKTQSLLRTRIFKEGPRYRFTIDWLHSPQMDLLGTVTFNLEDSGAGRNGAASDGSQAKEFEGLGDIQSKLQGALDRIFAKIPFVGQVTGRDRSDITVNVGSTSGIKKGDTLLVGTIEEVKKHPLLREIVEWRLAPVGEAEVDSVDEALVFAHVIKEEEGREAGRYQKITRILPAIEKPTDAAAAEPPKPEPLDEPPKLGFATASLWSGSFSRDYSSALANYSGGAFLYGARGAGQIWLNREFFADLSLGYGAFSYGQNDITGTATPAGSVGGSIVTFNMDLGYTYLLTNEFFGPRAWVKLGYRIDSFSLPVSPTEATAPFSVKSFYLGIGGDLPIRSGYGVDVSLDFGLFNSAGETGGINGRSTGSYDAVIYLGGYYRYKPRIIFKAGLEIHGNGANFDMPSSISQKTITILPSVQYLF